MEKLLHKYLSFFVVLIGISPLDNTLAQEAYFNGHIQSQTSIRDNREGSLGDLLGVEQPIRQIVDLRLNTEIHHQKMKFVFHNEFLGLATDGASSQDKRIPLQFQRPIFETDNRRFFDLSKNVSTDENFVTTVRFDRAYLEYGSENFVLRAGRQALSWGGGIVFQTLDLFNPFSPTEINKDYKIGDDLIYTQYLFDSGSDLQFLFVPRRTAERGNLREDQNSYALKYRAQVLDDIEFDLLFARHYGEALVGTGVSKELFGAIFRLDILALEADGENGGLSLVSNMDRTWEIYGYNVYSFIEYYHNGSGTNQDQYLSPPEDLRAKIARGELFTYGRHYVSHGFRIELTPLLDVVPSHIRNLDDKSGIVQVQFRYDIFNNTSAVFGVDFPYGKSGSEFGGIILPDNTSLHGGENYYLRCTYFF